ncbi:hypothetical protein ACWCQE_23295, partial [Streptomyces sp. NPDC002409]
MAPADAHADAGPGSAAQADTGAEDTLDLPLSGELLALCPATGGPRPGPRTDRPVVRPVPRRHPVLGDAR